MKTTRLKNVHIIIFVNQKFNLQEIMILFKNNQFQKFNRLHIKIRRNKQKILFASQKYV